MKIYSYCVKQNIVDWNGNIVQSDIVRDGIYTFETAQKCARELQNINSEEFRDLNLRDGYRYVFSAEPEEEQE